MQLIASIFSSRLKSLAVVGVWFALVALFVGGLGFMQKLSEAEDNSSTSGLSQSAESTLATKKIEKLQGNTSAPVIVVYGKASGLTAGDRKTVKEAQSKLNDELNSPSAPSPDLKDVSKEELAKSLSFVGSFKKPIFSKDGKTAIMTSEIADDAGGEGTSITNSVQQLRHVLKTDKADGGLEVKVGGPAGSAADAIAVFKGLDFALVVAALGLVTLILLIVFRSPVFFLIPLISVLFAEVMSRSLAYVVSELGVLINGQNTAIMSILVIGAGIDYALLLVFRYKEELHQHESHLEALKKAWLGSATAIFASALTVALALLVLLVAKTGSTSSIGPLGALGVLTTALAMLTLLPAILALCGRWVFWPSNVAYDPNYDPAAAHGVYGRVGKSIAKSPRRIWIGTAALLLVVAAFATQLNTNLSGDGTFTKTTESDQAQALIKRSFPAGESVPTQVLVGDSSKLKQTMQAVGQVDGVARVQLNLNPKTGKPLSGAEGTVFDVYFKASGYSSEAENLIPEIRKVAKAAGGQNTLVGGETAIFRDLRTDASVDTKRAIPLALVLIFLVLMVLLRAVLAPVILLATVVLSFAAALGASVLIWDLVGFPNTAPGQPLFIFIFLVALGVDYNIFLMDRVRREAELHGTQLGMMRGLGATGGVITAAGIVLAGTFAVLGSLPIVFLLQIGIAVGIGVLIDTFIVRSILVPALTFDLGKKVWWPSELSKSGKD